MYVMEEKIMELRHLNHEVNFQTREENDELIIEGYFAVFNSIYHIAEGMTEEIARGAFKESLDGDVRALINHDTTLVLGRTMAGTLEIREDEHGLWGRIRINPKDTDALNAYERVKRGDVSQCSIGFDIIREETESPENGGVHWTIKEVKLWEVSVCTFPAYQETEISARSSQLAEIKKREKEAWRSRMNAMLKGEKNGTESVNAEKED